MRVVGRVEEGWKEREREREREGWTSSPTRTLTSRFRTLSLVSRG